MASSCPFPFNKLLCGTNYERTGIHPGKKGNQAQRGKGTRVKLIFPPETPMESLLNRTGPSENVPQIHLNRSLYFPSSFLTIADTPQLSSVHSQSISINNKMGILQSLTAYFSSPHSDPLTEAKIQTCSHKLIIRIRNLQYKLQQEVFKAEQELTAQIRQQTAVRSREGERVRMDMIIRNSEKRLVYDEVIYCLNRVIVEAKELKTAPGTLSNECLLAVCSIIHVYEPLGLNQFVRLGEFLPEPLPTIDSSKTRPLIQRYLRKQEISHYQRNLYALELCGRSELSLGEVNVVGHGFVVDPVEPVEQTPSFQMFAVTLQELAVEEQDKQA